MLAWGSELRFTRRSSCLILDLISTSSDSDCSGQEISAMCGGRKGRRSVLAHRRRKRPRSSLVQVSMRASSGGVYGSAGWCWICGRTGGIPSRRAICVERIMLMQWVVLTGASITQCRRRERRFSGREGGAVFVVTSQRVWREQWAGVKLGSAATQRHSDSTRNRFFCCLRCHCSSYHHRARFSSTLPYLKHQSAGPGSNKSKRKSSGANGEPAVPCALTSWRVFHVAAVHPGDLQEPQTPQQLPF